MKREENYSLLKNNPQYDNLKVAIRVRPPLQREREEGIPFRSIAIVSQDHKSINLAELEQNLNENNEQDYQYLKLLNPNNLLSEHNLLFYHNFLS